MFMLPFTADWEHSRVNGAAPFVLMRNVNAGRRSIIGKSLLATLRVSLDGQNTLEWCLTPTRNERGKDTFMGHALLRLLFAEDQRPVILARDGEPLRAALPPDDLMLSWEAWRAPMTSCDRLQGLTRTPKCLQ